MSQPRKTQDATPDAPDTSTDRDEQESQPEQFLSSEQALSPNTTTHPSIKNN